MDYILSSPYTDEKYKTDVRFIQNFNSFLKDSPLYDNTLLLAKFNTHVQNLNVFLEKGNLVPQNVKKEFEKHVNIIRAKLEFREKLVNDTTWNPQDFSIFNDVQIENSLNNELLNSSFKFDDLIKIKIENVDDEKKYLVAIYAEEKKTCLKFIEDITKIAYPPQGGKKGGSKESDSEKWKSDPEIQKKIKDEVSKLLTQFIERQKNNSNVNTVVKQIQFSEHELLEKKHNNILMKITRFLIMLLCLSGSALLVLVFALPAILAAVGSTFGGAIPLLLPVVLIPITCAGIGYDAMQTYVWTHSPAWKFKYSSETAPLPIIPEDTKPVNDLIPYKLKRDHQVQHNSSALPPLELTYEKTGFLSQILTKTPPPKEEYKIPISTTTLTLQNTFLIRSHFFPDKTKPCPIDLKIVINDAQIAFQLTIYHPDTNNNQSKSFNFILNGSHLTGNFNTSLQDKRNIALNKKVEELESYLSKPITQEEINLNKSKLELYKILLNRPFNLIEYICFLHDLSSVSCFVTKIDAKGIFSKERKYLFGLIRTEIKVETVLELEFNNMNMTLSKNGDNYVVDFMIKKSSFETFNSPYETQTIQPLKVRVPVNSPNTVNSGGSKGKAKKNKNTQYVPTNNFIVSKKSSKYPSRKRKVWINTKNNNEYIRLRAEDGSFFFKKV
jgi:hypothetical protein